ncbi:MAG: hypothetical protein FWF10_05745 [Clostridiales bacterium]|nr:hypothetical protein [Clostridiales bacterium]
MKKIICILLLCLLFLPIQPVAAAETPAPETEWVRNDVETVYTISPGTDTLPAVFREAFVSESYFPSADLTPNFSSYVLLNPQSGDVLVSKSADAEMDNLGSVAGLMAVELALKHLGLNARVVLTEQHLTAAGEAPEEPDENAFLLPPGTYRVCELAAAVLLCDSNAAAAALAQTVAVQTGKTQAGAPAYFAVAGALQAYNEEAARLRMTNTVYTDLYAQEGSGQTTTAADLARLLYALYQQPDAQKLCNTDYLWGCLVRAGVAPVWRGDDLRDPAGDYYQPELSGFAYHGTARGTVFALGRDTNWAFPNANGRWQGQVLLCGSAAGALPTAAPRMLAAAEGGFGILNCRAMFAALLREQKCPRCRGTLAAHTDNCSYPVRALDLTGTAQYRTTDRASYAVLTELYDRNRYSSFTMAIDEGAIGDWSRPKPVGTEFAPAVVYYQGRPFIAAPLFVVGEATALDLADLVVPDADVPDGPQSLLPTFRWEMLAIIVPGVAVIVFFSIRMGRKKKFMKKF